MTPAHWVGGYFLVLGALFMVLWIAVMFHDMRVKKAGEPSEYAPVFWLGFLGAPVFMLIGLWVWP